MSAAMSPPRLAPQRAHAFINHSPESYREAISARAASRGSPKRPQQNSQTGQQRVGPAQTQLSQPQFAAASPGSVQAATAETSLSHTPPPMPLSQLSASNRVVTPTPEAAPKSTPRPEKALRSNTMPSTADVSSGGTSSGSECGSSHSSENEKRTKEFKDAPRKRRRTSPNELHILETEFARNNKPCKEERERIAATMGMDEKAVQVWFQNKRQSCRRQQTGTPASRTQSLPMIQTNAGFQDENASPAYGVPGQTPPFISKPAFAVHAPGAPSMVQPAKRAKSLRLAMSADGKAELVERSPLKPLHQNGAAATPMQFPQFAPVPHLAMRFASVPLTGMETECATSLLFLKSGHWP